jgi:predicted Na+-dependent transporter
MSDGARPVVKWLVLALVPLLEFSVGLATSAKDLRRESHNPVLWRALAAALVAVPALAIVVAWLMPLHPLGEVVLLLMGISPGAPLLMARARREDRNRGLVVVLGLALSFAAAFTVPAWLVVANLVFPYALHTSIPSLAAALVPSLWAPLAAGLLVRAAWPRTAARLETVASRLYMIDLVLVGLAVLVLAAPHLGRISVAGWCAIFLVTLGGALLGDLIARHQGVDPPTIAYAVVLGNPAIALLVVRTSYPNFDAAPFIVLYVIGRFIVMAIYEQVSRRVRSRSGSVSAT